MSQTFIPKDSINNTALLIHRGLVHNRRQGIIWTNDGLVYWHIYASLDELSRNKVLKSDESTRPDNIIEIVM